MIHIPTGMVIITRILRRQALVELHWLTIATALIALVDTKFLELVFSEDQGKRLPDADNVRFLSENPNAFLNSSPRTSASHCGSTACSIYNKVHLQQELSIRCKNLGKWNHWGLFSWITVVEEDIQAGSTRAARKVHPQETAWVSFPMTIAVPAFVSLVSAQRGSYFLRREFLPVVGRALRKQMKW